MTADVVATRVAGGIAVITLGSPQADINALNRSFSTASLGVLTPRCNHSRTLVTVSVCFTELRTSTSNRVKPPGSSSCLRNAHNPKTDASYKTLCLDFDRMALPHF
jgi:hypothetical protein